MGSLTAAIVSGERDPGEVLPREEVLASEFQVSRGVTREAIRALEERGLVTVRHGRGASVNPRSEWNLLDADVLAAVLAAPQRPELLGEAIECLGIVEGEGAALAAERADPEDHDVLDEGLGAMRDAAERSQVNPAARYDYQDAQLEFRRALLRASRNTPLARMAEPIEQALALAGPPPPLQRLQPAVQEHQRILEAVANRQPDAARKAMQDHVERRTAELLDDDHAIA